MAFNIALSGLRAANSDLSITGNNIANASTVGFKRSRAEFSDVYANSVLGSGGNAIGSGVLVSEVAQIFTQGNISYTKNSLDLAINGSGFFVQSNAGAISYSRAGQFGLDNQGYVVSNDGFRLQGFQSDGAGNIPGGAYSDLQLESANLPPRQTTGIDMSLNLDAASLPSVTPFDPSDRRTFAFTQASEVFDSLGVRHTGTLYFSRDTAANDWTLHVRVDGRDVGPDAPTAASATGTAISFPVNVTTGVDDTFTFDLDGAPQSVTLTGGANTFASLKADIEAQAPGSLVTQIGNNIVITSATTGVTSAVNNFGGSAQALLGFSTPTVVPGGVAPSGASFNLVFNSDGSFNETLSDPILIDNWIPLDADGNPTGAYGPAPGAAPTDPPVSSNFTLSLTGSTQLGTASTPYATSQTGYAAGRLSGIDVSGEGVIFARYTNGQARALGQVALANFQNPQGLQPIGSTAWAQTSTSGEPVVGAPQTGAFGAVQSGAVEDSNVELSDELVNLIIAQRNFQANAKTIETANAITQTVINLR